MPALDRGRSPGSFDTAGALAVIARTLRMAFGAEVVEVYAPAKAGGFMVEQVTA